MDIEVLDYLRGLQAGEYGIAHLGVLYLGGFLSVALSRKLLPTRQPLELLQTVLLAALAPLLGLILTSTTYPCPSCEAPAGCELVRVGIPWPQQIREKDPGVVGPCWLSATSPSQSALAVNFLLGTLVLPFVFTLFRPQLEGSDQDPTRPNGSTPPQTTIPTSPTGSTGPTGPPMSPS